MSRPLMCVYTRVCQMPGASKWGVCLSDLAIFFLSPLAYESDHQIVCEPILRCAPHSQIRKKIIIITVFQENSMKLQEIEKLHEAELKQMQRDHEAQI